MRTGPFDWMKAGMVFCAPNRVARLTCGFTAGLLPPGAGNAWQETQLFELNRGPSPVPAAPGSVPETESISRNRVRPSRKVAISACVSPGSGAPVGGVPCGPRGGPPGPGGPPGGCAKTKAAVIRAHVARSTIFDRDIGVLYFGWLVFLAARRAIARRRGGTKSFKCAPLVERENVTLAQHQAGFGFFELRTRRGDAIDLRQNFRIVELRGLHQRIECGFFFVQRCVQVDQTIAALLEDIIELLLLIGRKLQLFDNLWAIPPFSRRCATRTRALSGTSAAARRLFRRCGDAGDTEKARENYRSTFHCALPPPADKSSKVENDDGTDRETSEWIS